jgi:hypothetical protein
MLGKYVYPLQAIVCTALALSACTANGQQNVTANYVATLTQNPKTKPS